MYKYASKICNNRGNIIALTYRFDPETYNEIVVSREFKAFDTLVKWTISEIAAGKAKPGTAAEGADNG